MSLDQNTINNYNSMRARGITPLQMHEMRQNGVDPLRQPRVPRPGLGKVLPAVLLLAFMGSYAQPARADDPLMDVNVTRTVDDYHPGLPGLESLFTITVYNQSDPGVNNNMINFTYPAGEIDNGVFYVIPGTGWTPYINDGDILFDGLLEPGAFAQHQVYSTLTGTGLDYATALALGPPQTPFNPVEVAIPVPEPGTLGLLALGAIGLRRR